MRMGLADKAVPIGDAILEFLRGGGTVDELKYVLTAWSVAAGLVNYIKTNDEG